MGLRINWGKVRDAARLIGALAGSKKVKGVEVATIANEAEKVGSAVAASVHSIQDARKKPSGSTGE